LSFGVPSAGNPSWKSPTEEMADYMGKVILVSNLSYLFSVGTTYVIFTFIKKKYLMS